MSKKEQVVPRKIPFEIVREVSGNEAPVVIKRTMINKTAEIIHFPRMKPLPRTYFVNCIIRREKTVKTWFGFRTKVVVDYVVRVNQYWSEALSSLTETMPKFSLELENLAFADEHVQHMNGVVGAAQKFALDGTMIKLMIVVFGMSIPFGLFMNAFLHLIPTQIVDWQP